MCRTRRILMLAPCALPAMSRPPRFAQGDKDFLDARTAFERGDRIRLDALAPKLSDHVLAPYVEFWQKKLKLDSATDARDQPPTSPAGRRLRSRTGCASIG